MKGFKIIKASAGSGKTHSLTKEYLQLLFYNPLNYKQTLAVTFTNKATAEMKERILRELQRIAINNKSPFVSDICKSHGLNLETVQKQAKSLLNMLLHDYSGFAVMTIDTFFQRVIRSFARELGLQGFELELDYQLFLSEGVKNLIDSSSVNHNIYRWLNRFSEKEIQEKGNWNISRSVKNWGTQIFSENYKINREYINTSEIPDLEKYLEELKKLEIQLSENLIQLGKLAILEIESENLSYQDFYQGEKGIYGFYKQLSLNGEIKSNSFIANAIIGSGQWYKKDNQKADNIERIKYSLTEIFNKAKEISIELNTVRLILKNFFYLGLTQVLEEQVLEACRRKNAFLINDAGYFLRGIISESDTPFVFEKIGTRIRNIMIDEFQDTSILQWNNFKPLISSSLSSNDFTLVVGDVKQSIYRWRNGNWKILLNEAEKSFSSFPCTIENLQTNYRSLQNIIEFNNYLFKSASDNLANLIDNEIKETESTIEHNAFGTTIKLAYSDISQGISPNAKLSDQKGFIHLEFIEPNKTDQGEETTNSSSQISKTIDWIENIQEAGYQAEEIAVLVRRNFEAKQVVEALVERKNSNIRKSGVVYEVISGEALKISGSLPVKFIISIISWLDQPYNSLIITELNWFHECLKHKNDNSAFLYNQSCIPSPVFSIMAAEWQQKSLVSLIESLIKEFNLDDDSTQVPYLTAFIDIATEFSSKNPFVPSLFISWWNEYGEKRNLTSPESGNAIRIYTIHKAKGLQFRIVLVPFVNWELDHRRHYPVLWCPSPSFLPKSSLIPLNYSKEMANSHFAQEYFREKLETYVDNLNILYVAFTRAIEGLIVFSPYSEKKLKKDSCPAFSNIGNLLQYSMQNCNDTLNDINELNNERKGIIYQLGVLQNNNETKIQNVTPNPFQIHFPVTNHFPNLKINENALVNSGLVNEIRTNDQIEGMLLHLLFGRIFTINDVKKACESLVFEGYISNELSQKLEKSINEKLAREPINNWFSGNWQIKNEKSILKPGGEVKIPDRVMFNKNEIVVIDFKFGKTIKQEYQNQINSYLQIISDMGHLNAKAYIWYYSLDKIEVFSL